MQDKSLLERSLRELSYALEYSPDQENINTLLKRLSNVEEIMEFDDVAVGESARLKELFTSVQTFYSKPAPEDRSLGKVLCRVGLDTYQSYRLVQAQTEGYSPKDEKKRLKDALETILEDGVRYEERGSNLE